MVCPHCNVNLAVSERQGVEIDHCPQCRGVWLDRGKLDKILERYAAYDDGGYGGPARFPGDHRPHHAPRRKSFWQELFD